MVTRMISSLVPSERTRAWLALVVAPFCAYVAQAALTVWLAAQVEWRDKLSEETAGPAAVVPAVVMLLGQVCFCPFYLFWRKAMASPTSGEPICITYGKIAGAWRHLLMHEEIVADGHWRAQLPRSVVWFSDVSDACKAEDLGDAVRSIFFCTSAEVRERDAAIATRVVQYAPRVWCSQACCRPHRLRLLHRAICLSHFETVAALVALYPQDTVVPCRFGGLDDPAPRPVTAEERAAIYGPAGVGKPQHSRWKSPRWLRGQKRLLRIVRNGMKTAGFSPTAELDSLATCLPRGDRRRQRRASLG